MLGCLHRGVVLAPLPPMFNATQLSALLAADAARRAIVAFGGEKEIAKCEQVAGERRRSCSRSLPELVDELDRRATCRPTRAPRARRRPRAWSCTPPGRRRRRRASRTRATRCATRPRASAGAGGSTGDDIYLVVVRVRLRRRPRLRLLPACCSTAPPACSLNRWNAEEALRLIEEHRCTYVLRCRRTPPTSLRAAQRDDARPVLDARARRARA